MVHNLPTLESNLGPSILNETGQTLDPPVLVFPVTSATSVPLVSVKSVTTGKEVELFQTLPKTNFFCSKFYKPWTRKASIAISKPDI